MGACNEGLHGARTRMRVPTCTAAAQRPSSSAGRAGYTPNNFSAHRFMKVAVTLASPAPGRSSLQAAQDSTGGEKQGRFCSSS